MVFNKSLLLALDERCKEENSLLYDPLIVGRRGNLADGYVYLLDRGILDTWMRQRASALVAEDIGQLLKPDLDGFGGVDVLGQVRRFAPDGLRGRQDCCC